MKKRGLHAQLWMMVEIVLWGMAFFMFLSKVNEVKNDTQFEKLFLSRDLALMTETVSNMPGDVLYTYQTKANLSKYHFDFVQDVRIRDKGAEISYGYPFYFDNHYSTNFQSLEGPKKIMFGKLGGVLKINENLVDEPDQETCPTIQTKGSLQTVILDHQTDDFAYLLARSLQAKLLTDKTLVSTLSRGKEPTLIEDRLAKINLDTDLVFSIYPGADNSRKALAYYKDEKSRKLSCLILNSIKKAYPDVEISMLPSTDALLNQNANGIAVKLEIVKMTAPKDISRLTTAIYDAMRRYNEER